MAITMLFLQLSLSLSSSQATLLLYSSARKQTLNYSANPEAGTQHKGSPLTFPWCEFVRGSSYSGHKPRGAHQLPANPSLTTAFARVAAINCIMHSVSGIISTFNERILT